MILISLALQPPSGPVYVSIPLDDWDQPALGPAAVRTVSERFAPDGDRLREFAKRISASKKLALVYGQEIERSGGREAGVALAEKLNAPVFHAPSTELPSLDIVSTAKGFDCAAVEARTRQEVQAAFSKALNANGPRSSLSASNARSGHSFRPCLRCKCVVR
jgi:thiamine pyrophosphate-dependent acetolactate synthase large subunit-like protein